MNVKEAESFHEQICLKLKEESSKKCQRWSTALCGAETWTLWKAEQKNLGSFEMWFWRRMEKISWSDSVRNEEALERVKEEKNILQTIKGWKEG
jgi:hypothetical protein